MTTLKILICSAAALTLQSCLKEKECPPQAASLFVAVQDINYDNIGEVEQAVPVDANLAFGSYVSSLNTRYAALSGPDILKQYVTPTTEERAQRLDISALTGGRHEISAIGNADGDPFSSADPVSLIELHPGNSESSDIYYGRDTLDFPLTADRTIPMLRAKGKLLLLYENFPDGITRIDVLTDGISKSLDNTLQYNGTTQVKKTFLLPVSSASGQLEFLLGPTPTSGTVSLILYDQNGTPVNIISDIALNIQRNRITPTKVVYDPDLDTWEIWVVIEGQWTRLHDLTIE